ncbi:hypothetical protein BJX66DRAFT_336675 [Aspergillus keveii]|uniref:LysM domain-containing protein n=1 Tax=Aspergillus keveii TaxID=714993 RepID=A0ABR4G9R3_9EURO
MSTCALQPGYRYCALKDDSYEITDYSSKPNWDGCLPVNATEPTTASDCNCFTITYGSFAGGMLCSYIESSFNITVDQLQTWNPWLAGNCDTALYADLNATDWRAVCVGVGPPKTTWTFTTFTLEPSSTTGVVAGCQKYYTVASGDDCSTIESEFGVTLAQLYDWNPSSTSPLSETIHFYLPGYLSSIRRNLYEPLARIFILRQRALYHHDNNKKNNDNDDVKYQTVIASNCNRYYTVVSGDSCAKIESSYSVTFAQLYEWNPAIGANCGSLWVGYDVCVGVS